MGTHCRTEPLSGLELDLSVDVVYIKISIAWKREKEKDKFQTAFVDSDRNHMLREELRNERRDCGAFRASLRLFLSDIKHLKGTRPPVFTVTRTAALHWQGLFSGEALAGWRDGGWRREEVLECERVCAYVHMHQILYFRKDINSLYLVQKNSLSWTLPVTAPLSASLNSGKKVRAWSRRGRCLLMCFLLYSSTECSRTVMVKSLGYRFPACWVNKSLGSVSKHTESPETSNGKSKSSEAEGSEWRISLSTPVPKAVCRYSINRL